MIRPTGPANRAASPRRALLAPLLLMALALPASTARAGITFYDVFKVQYYSQTGNAQPASPAAFAGFANVNASNPSDLSGGNVTSSSPLSPMALTGSGGNYSFGQTFATKAILDSAFPNSATYTFNLTGGTFNGQSASLTTPAADAYSATVPYFTNNAFTALQGVSAGSAINLTFNPYATPGGVNTPLTFIEIDRVSDGQVAYTTSGTNALTSATVAANTLLAGTQYDLSIVYSSRLVTSGAGFGDATAFSAYDLRTDLIFTTAAAVPEPASLALVGIGLASVAVALRKRGAKPSA